MALLKQVVELWRGQIQSAEEDKARLFGNSASRAWKYLGRDYQPLIYEDEHTFPDGEEGGAKPVIVGKSSEFVALMMPYISARVPHRMVMPSRPELPDFVPLPPGLPQEAQEAFLAQLQANRAMMDQQDAMRAWLLEFYLNYICRHGYDLIAEARRALPEALVKGIGVLWTEVTEGSFGPMPASYYDSIDNLLIDPDAERLEDASWIVRKRRMSLWKIAEMFDRDVEELRGSYESSFERANNSRYGSDTRNNEGDVGEYYEVWSRMGLGHKLHAASEEMKQDGVAEALDQLGPFVFLAIMPGVEEPLNVPESVLGMGDDNGLSEILARTQWPLPFYADPIDPWPCTLCSFYPNERDPWAQSPLSSGLQCQIFLDQLYYYLMRRARTASRDIIVTNSEVSDEIKKAMQSESNFALVDTDIERVSDLIEVLKFPELTQDVWTIAAAMEQQFERATGMTPFWSTGQAETQSRSATDAQARQANMTSRPDDYADIVEGWMSRIAAKEAMVARLYSPPPYALFGEPMPEAGLDGQPVLNPQVSYLSSMWAQLVMTDDPRVAASELSYSVEAGSTRRKNKQKQAADTVQLNNSLSQQTYEYGAMTGNYAPYNALLDMVGESLDAKVSEMYLPNIVPPQPEESKGEA